MARLPRTLTAFGKDLDFLLEKAGKISIREYADQANVGYKYVIQLRTVLTRQPGSLYPNLLKPFVRLNIIDIFESHKLSLRHRNKPLSIAECQELFPAIPEQEVTESIRQALESEARHDAITETVVPPRITYSPLYHRVFVGRETELGQLQSVFDSAISGRGSLMMVVGEPGIGKTVLCEQLATYVGSLGGKSLVGHCYSEKSLSRPYLAFVEVLRSYIQARGVSQLRKELGSGAADLGRIVPEIRERLKVRARPKRDADEEKYRLMEAVTHFLSSIAAAQPLLIVLEDLHNADKDTLEMLTHVSRSLASTRLLVVGTYRDVEVDRSHPLSETLAELRRLSVFERVALKGLSVDIVKQMLSAITGKEMPVGLAELIHRHTEGNPLFVQEVIRYLVEEGLISPQGEIGQAPTDTSIEMRIPDSLKDVIGRRLSRLSGPCNNILATAAVIGRDFRLELLQRVSDLTDEELFKALEEAIKAAVIEEKTGILATVNYRFAHAFFRQTLYEEIIAPRRIRLQQQVGKAIEEIYAGHLEEHAAELAEHLSYSSDPADLAKAVSYGEMAAQQAIDIYAYWEALRLLEKAVQVHQVLDPENKEKQCDLLLATAETLIYAGEPGRAIDTELPAVFSLIETIGDSKRASEACRITTGVLLFGGANINTPEVLQWVESADRYVLPSSSGRAWADILLAFIKFNNGEWAEAAHFVTRGLELSRRLDDLDLLYAAIGWLLTYKLAPQHQQERLSLAEEHFERTREWVRTRTAIFRSPRPLFNVFMESGYRTRAEQLVREHREMTERTAQVIDQGVLMFFDALLAILDGHLEEALDIAQRIRSFGEETGMVRWNRAGIRGFMPRIQLYIGQADEALQSWRLPVNRAICLAHLGRNGEVTEILKQLVLARPEIGTAEDETPVWWDIVLLEAAVLTGHRQVSDLLLHRFSGTSLCTAGHTYITCVARHLGAAAALLDRPEEARNHYQEAIRVCTDMRFRPELALTRLQLAELLLEHYPDEKSDALEHLDFAINEFREMKMQPSLERALRHKEILGV